jgi:hypothetical protein
VLLAFSGAMLFQETSSETGTSMRLFLETRVGCSPFGLDWTETIIWQDKPSLDEFTSIHLCIHVMYQQFSTRSINKQIIKRALILEESVPGLIYSCQVVLLYQLFGVLFFSYYCISTFLYLKIMNKSSFSFPIYSVNFHRFCVVHPL